MNYDPATGPDPKGLEEAEQIDLVVENQVALNDPPAVAVTLERLQKQGLPRHEAQEVATRREIDTRTGLRRGGGVLKQIVWQHERGSPSS